MKKIAALLSIILICALTACGGNKALDPEKIEEGTPEATVLKMFELMEETNLDQIAAFLGKDQATQFEAGGFIDLIASSNDTLTYEINKAKVSGDTATVDVTCTYKDLQPIFAETFRNYVADVLAYSIGGQEPSEEEMTDMMAYELSKAVDSEEGEAGTSNITVTINCIKKDDIWQIDMSEANKALQDVMTGNLISAYASASNAMDSSKAEK